MAIRVINTPQNIPFFTQRTTLDGREYLLTFDWNQREQKWYLSIADQDEVPIVSSIKLVANFPLTHLLVDSRSPPGELFAMDTSGNGLDPLLSDLGTRVLLLYMDAEDLVAAVT